MYVEPLFFYHFSLLEKRRRGWLIDTKTICVQLPVPSLFTFPHLFSLAAGQGLPEVWRSLSLAHIRRSLFLEKTSMTIFVVYSTDGTATS